MKLYDACKQVMETKSLHLVRLRKRQEEGEPLQYDAKPWEGNKRGWVLLDLFTASVVCRVYEAINEANKAKLDRLPVQKAVDVCYQLVK